GRIQRRLRPLHHGRNQDQLRVPPPFEWYGDSSQRAPRPEVLSQGLHTQARGDLNDNGLKCRRSSARRGERAVRRVIGPAQADTRESAVMAKNAWGCATLLLFTTGLLSLHAQQPSFTFPGIQYPKGNDVSPTFDAWEKNPDGTFSMWFGYFNRNTQEEIDVPIGPENSIDLGNGDQGQPTHFYPGRRWWVFKVVVPK